VLSPALFLSVGETVPTDAFLLAPLKGLFGLALVFPVDGAAKRLLLLAESFAAEADVFIFAFAFVFLTTSSTVLTSSAAPTEPLKEEPRPELARNELARDWADVVLSLADKVEHGAAVEAVLRGSAVTPPILPVIAGFFATMPPADGFLLALLAPGCTTVTCFSFAKLVLSDAFGAGIREGLFLGEIFVFANEFFEVVVRGVVSLFEVLPICFNLVFFTAVSPVLPVISWCVPIFVQFKKSIHLLGK